MVASRCVRLVRCSTSSRSRRFTIPASSDRLSRNAPMTCASANAVLLPNTNNRDDKCRVPKSKRGRGGRSYIRPDVTTRRLVPVVLSVALLALSACSTDTADVFPMNALPRSSWGRSGQASSEPEPGAAL